MKNRGFDHNKYLQKIELLDLQIARIVRFMNLWYQQTFCSRNYFLVLLSSGGWITSLKVKCEPRTESATNTSRVHQIKVFLKFVEFKCSSKKLFAWKHQNFANKQPNLALNLGPIKLAINLQNRACRAFKVKLMRSQNFSSPLTHSRFNPWQPTVNNEFSA